MSPTPRRSATRGEPSLSLAQLLQEYRARTGDSYADMARKTGISKAQVGLLVNGHGPHVPRRETLEALATGLGISLRLVTSAAVDGASGSNRAGGTAAEEALLATYRSLSPAHRQTVRTIVNALAREAGQ